MPTGEAGDNREESCTRILLALRGLHEDSHSLPGGVKDCLKQGKQMVNNLPHSSESQLHHP
ncbi:MAG: hypothetical protein FGF48_10745 [Candidatus Brockarchaeota archaeon]|nr:hypothetical protein [Candidatus Brockarchaeota archaeon]